MKTPTTLATLATLERQKADLLAGVKEWPAAHLAFRPAPRAWSAVEVVDHLVRVEAGILDAARAGLAMPHAVGAGDRLRTWLLDALFRSPARVRVPGAVPQVLPARVPDADAGSALATRIARWDAVRGDVATFLVPLTAADRRAGVFRHPVGGWMDVPAVLRFFWVHAHHHGFQLGRLAAAAARAAPGR